VGLGYNCDERTNMVGVGRKKPEIAPAYDIGPAITVIDRFGTLESLNEARYVIEDLSMPKMFGDGIRTPLALTFKQLDSFKPAKLKRLTADLLPGFAPYGALNFSLFMLGVGRDRADGRLVLDGGAITIKWPEVKSDPVYAKIEERMAAYSK